MKKTIPALISFYFCLSFSIPVYSQPSTQVKSIEVIGYAELEKGGLISELQRHAIKDALKNALLLSNCTIEYKAVSENLKLKSSRITYKSSGFIKHSKVISSEIIKKTDPMLYKVILQVEIVPVANEVSP